MTWLADALVTLWRKPSPGGLGSEWKPTASAEEIAAAWPDSLIPDDAVELWAVCRSARLYADTAYGQWGLVLLSPAASAARTALERAARPEDVTADDLVIGEFLGDLDLLILAPGERDERRVLVALPLDPRVEWYGVGSSLADFLVAYGEADGDKWWEAGAE